MLHFQICEMKMIRKAYSMHSRASCETVIRRSSQGQTPTAWSLYRREKLDTLQLQHRKCDESIDTQMDINISRTKRKQIKIENIHSNCSVLAGIVPSRCCTRLNRAKNIANQ